MGATWEDKMLAATKAVTKAMLARDTAVSACNHAIGVKLETERELAETKQRLRNARDALREVEKSLDAGGDA